jgi:hypothetical protein
MKAQNQTNDRRLVLSEVCLWAFIPLVFLVGVLTYNHSGVGGILSAVLLLCTDVVVFIWLVATELSR